MESDVPAITDPHQVREIVVSAIAGIEESSGFVTITFVTNRSVPDGFGETRIERAITARLAMGKGVLEEFVKSVSEYLEQ